MKSRSAKNKGVRLQNIIKQMILDRFDIPDSDIKPAIMGETGVDIHLSKNAQNKLPLAIEAKNQEKLNIWKALEQAELNSDGLLPVVVFKRNHSDIYCALKFSELLKIFQELSGDINADL